MDKIQEVKGNPLGYERIGKLIIKYSIPSIASMLMNAVYNIVDQIYIGWGIGELGMAATNVAFPLVTLCTAMGLLFGVGGATNLSIDLGEGKQGEANKVSGNAIALVVIGGVIAGILAFIFLEELLIAFGTTENVMVYAKPYTRLIAIGIPFMVFSIGASQLIRADGSPTYSMLCMLAGAVFNIVFDPIFLFVLDMGIEGIALATVLGQVLSSAIALVYLLKKTKHIKITKDALQLKASIVKVICALGIAASFNQLAMTVLQITMNNTLTYYGGMSEYGSDVPLAAVGAVSKIMMVFISIVLGVSQGCQPIIGFNYGAKKYDRVKKILKFAILVTSIYSILCFAAFQLFPEQILSIFGTGSDLYVEFAVKYMRIYMFMSFVVGAQVISSNFFTAIGKSMLGLILSMTRQILFLLPLLLILPRFFGIEGALYAGPIADGAAFILTMIFIFKQMKQLSNNSQERLAA